MNFNLFVAVLLLSIASCQQGFRLIYQPYISGDLNQPFEYQISTIGENGLVTFNVFGLPPGLSRQGSIISGIPRAAGTFTITIQAIDSAQNTD